MHYIEYLEGSGILTRYLILLNLLCGTSHVLCKYSNGEQASLANLKNDYRLFVGMAKA